MSLLRAENRTYEGAEPLQGDESQREYYLSLQEDVYLAEVCKSLPTLDYAKTGDATEVAINESRSCKTRTKSYLGRTAGW